MSGSIACDCSDVVVIKVGTSTLIDSDGRPSDVFKNIAREVRQLHKQDKQVLLISSGAIGFGMRRTGIDDRPPQSDMASLQALSMIGQPDLMAYWQAAFGDTPVAQALTTKYDFDSPHQMKRLCASVQAVWRYQGVPIFNENDAISTTEIAYGDNDVLAAQLARAFRATSLFLLTNQSGIQKDFGTKHQQRLDRAKIQEAQRHVTSDCSDHGTGGASSKLDAAELALSGGVGDVYIANASLENVINQVMIGKAGTKLVL